MSGYHPTGCRCDICIAHGSPVECPHCAAKERVKDAAQKFAYQCDKARVEADDRARFAEAKLAEADARVLVLQERVTHWRERAEEAEAFVTRVKGALLKP